MIGVGKDVEQACRTTEFLDHESAEVRRFVERALTDDPGTPRERAVRLYYAVRDRVLYEIYGADLSRDGLRASHIAESRTGFCIHKSVLYAASLRSVGIPSRLVLTDVRNHLASERLKSLLGGEVFRFHCLTSVYLDGGWVKATPVFNKSLCRLYGLKPLEFDGLADSLHHPYDDNGQRYMEFLRTHGEFDDLPYDLLVDGLRAAHPQLFKGRYAIEDGSLVAEAEAS